MANKNYYGKHNFPFWSEDNGRDCPYFMNSLDGFLCHSLAVSEQILLSEIGVRILKMSVLVV